MIPRRDLFENPQRAGAQLSPDGRWLSWLAPTDGVMNLRVAPIDAPERERRLTFDTRRGVPSYFWTWDAQQIVYAQDRDGDENWQLFAVGQDGGAARALTPFPGVRTTVVATSRRIRDRIVVSLNRRDPRHADLYSLRLADGEMKLIATNPGFGGFIVDEDYRVRFATRRDAAGGVDLMRAGGGLDVMHATGPETWDAWLHLSAEDARNSRPSHLDAAGTTLYFYDSRGRDTAALTAIDLESGATTVLAEDARVDIGWALTEASTFRPLAYAVVDEKRVLHALDNRVQADLDTLGALGDWHLTSRTEDDSIWLVSASTDIRPPATYRYDRARRRLEKLFELRPALVGQPLARMQSTTLTARDGLKLVSYLTLPRAADTGEPFSARSPLPLVVIVHGGPWVRDGFGFETTHQWLADRGYAVLKLNFRGSAGFGKAFVDAGNGEWGAKMDDDIDDAVQWAVDAGVADPARLAIMGTSYGGFAVLSALTRQPKRYACGIDIVGPSNLETLLRSIPAYWASERAVLYRAVGNPETAEGARLLRERSPLHRADAIEAPLLVAQGANDPRVKRSEADRMVEALVSRSIPVTYALFPDEGHGLAREPNRLALNAVIEGFLAQHLGGRAEPYRLADDFAGSSLELLQGADLLAGA